MNKEELVKFMQNHANKEIAIPKTHDPNMPSRVLTQAEMKPVSEKISEPEEEVVVEAQAKVAPRKYEPVTELELLKAIYLQTQRTNTLLTHIRNLTINRPFDWKSPEEEVQNGEIS